MLFGAVLTELQLARGIQPCYGEQRHEAGNKDTGRGTKTRGGESRKFGGEQLRVLNLAHLYTWHDREGYVSCFVNMFLAMPPPPQVCRQKKKSASDEENPYEVHRVANIAQKKALLELLALQIPQQKESRGSSLEQAKGYITNNGWWWQRFWWVWWESVHMSSDSLSYILAQTFAEANEVSHLNGVWSVCEPQQQMTMQIASTLGLHRPDVCTNKSKHSRLGLNMWLRHFDSH